ncbi:hypothetical protein glysoja_011824 [Glycine soja]|nr:hypothetical protein glysoja_011824 [Glycine soja]
MLQKTNTSSGFLYVTTQNAGFNSQTGGTGTGTASPSQHQLSPPYLQHSQRLLLCSQTFATPTASSEPHSLSLPHSPTSSFSLMPLLFHQISRLSLPTNDLASLRLQSSPQGLCQKPPNRLQAQSSLFYSTQLQFQP